MSDVHTVILNSASQTALNSHFQRYPVNDEEMAAAFAGEEITAASAAASVGGAGARASTGAIPGKPMLDLRSVFVQHVYVDVHLASIPVWRSHPWHNILRVLLRRNLRILPEHRQLSRVWHFRQLVF